jgi:nucleotide-binding universal stress UspA family protein
MTPTIMVPLDGSRLAEQAIPTSVSLARALGAEVLLAHVHQHTFEESAGSGALSGDADVRLRDREHGYLEGVARGLAHAGVGARTSFLEAPVVQALLDEARLSGAFMIVMATHGYTGVSHAWLGSVTDEMVRRAPIPLVLVRPTVDPPMGEAAMGLAKLLVPLDGSRLSEQVLVPAGHVAKAAGAEIVLVRVIEPASVSSDWLAVSGMEQARVAAHLVDAEVADARSYLERQAARLPIDPDRVRTEVLVAPQPAIAMLDFADRIGVSLIALATHSKTGLADLLLGSMADKVLRGSSIPVMFLRPRVEPVAQERIREWAPGTKEPLKLH